MGNSFCKQTHDVPSYSSMHTFGNYGTLPEFQHSAYAYGGLNLDGDLDSQVVSDSPKSEATNMHRVRINTPPNNQACALLNPASRVSTQGYNMLSHGMLSQKAEELREVTEKSSDKNQICEMKLETTTTLKPRTNSREHQTQTQPQIFPWMTKLHINHGKVGFNVFVSKNEKITTYLSYSLSRFHPVPFWSSVLCF